MAGGQQNPDTDSARLAQLSARITRHFRELAAGEWRQYGTHLYFATQVAEGISELTHDGLATVFLEASDSGWSAIVLHDSLPGTACGTYVGNVAAPNRLSKVPGEIACTGDGAGLVRPGPVSLQMTHILLATNHATASAAAAAR